MKKSILILALIISVMCIAQDKRFTAYSFVDPIATRTDGFNLGFGIDYQMTIMYFKAQVFAFPNLRGKDYLEFTATPLGFNHHFLQDHFRVNTGLKLGVILRDGGPHPTYGFEAGLEFYPFRQTDGIYFGAMVSRDRRTDGKVWDPDILPYWRNSGFVKVGCSF